MESWQYEGRFWKNGNGAAAICHHLNKQYLSHPSDKQLTRSTITRAVRNCNQHGESPMKKGPRATVTNEITDQVAMQAAMLQASGEGEATTRKLTDTLVSLTAGTNHEGSFDPDYAVKKTRRLNPAVFAPVNAINDDDRRIEWLTYKNLNDWTNAIKKELINLDVVKDVPGPISKWVPVVIALFFANSSHHLSPQSLFSSDGTHSEVSLGHPDDAR